MPMLGMLTMFGIGGMLGMPLAALPGGIARGPPVNGEFITPPVMSASHNWFFNYYQ